MSSQQTPHATPQAIAEAKAMWAKFTKAGTIAAVATAALLCIMAITLI